MASNRHGGAPASRFSMQGRRLLIVEDDLTLRKRLLALLMQSEAEVRAVGSLAEARAEAAAADHDMVLLDVNLPDGNGLDLLREHLFPETTPVVVMTGQGDIETVIQALRNGAADYLAKPFDPFQLPLVFERCKQRREARRRLEHERVHSLPRNGDMFFGASMEPIRLQVVRILDVDHRMGDRPAPLLIVGETGTGKTTLARQIHYAGPRAERPFVDLNCATLSDGLIESELFGHERGAFTDAKGTRIGLFEAADGGTLLLDEIASLPLASQAKLLTAIEDGCIRRVGGNQRIEIDVRLIAASLDDLQQKVAENTFRADLYHRLNVIRIDLPPLRRGAGDLIALANHLLAPIRRQYRTPHAEISPRGVQRILAYPWPGNVRELKHELERQVVLHGDGPLDLDTLPEAMTASPAGVPDDWLHPGWRFPEDGFSIEQAEMRLIRLALRQTGDNVSAAARLLGVNRDFLRYRLAKA